MRLSVEDIRKVASLAKLEIDDSQLAILSAKLLNVLELVDQLNQVDTAGIDEMAHPFDIHSVLRSDDLSSSLSVESAKLFREAALGNAPRSDGEYFLVPPVLG